MPDRSARDLILVTGPGRSGTSALTGMLSMLGTHVPGPLVAANRSNERGFYETRWVVDFQKSLLNKAYSYEFDGDPRARRRVDKIITDEVRDTLSGWLRTAGGERPLVAIKDPRSIWFHDLWTDAAGRNGYRVGYLTTLRHPAEVVGSRTAQYSTEKRQHQAREYAVAKVAGWVHVSLLNERETRGQPRSFVRYDQLVEQWRPVASAVEQQLNISFPDRPDPWTAPHPVDDFLTPRLHRVTTGWDDLDCPEPLRTLADETWAACLQLAGNGRDADTDARFDDLTVRYSRLYRDSAAIVADMATSRVDRAKDRATKKARAELTAKRARCPRRLRAPFVRVGQSLPLPVRREVRRVIDRARARVTATRRP